MTSVWDARLVYHSDNMSSRSQPPFSWIDPYSTYELSLLGIGITSILSKFRHHGQVVSLHNADTQVHFSVRKKTEIKVAFAFELRLEGRESFSFWGWKVGFCPYPGRTGLSSQKPANSMLSDGIQILQSPLFLLAPSAFSGLTTGFFCMVFDGEKDMKHYW